MKGISETKREIARRNRKKHHTVQPNEAKSKENDSATLDKKKNKTVRNQQKA